MAIDDCHAMVNHHEDFNQSIQRMDSAVANVQHQLTTLEPPNSAETLAVAQQNIEICRSELAQNMSDLSRAESVVIGETSPEGHLVIEQVADESKAKLQLLNAQLDAKYAEFATRLDTARKAENIAHLVSILIHNEAEILQSLESEPLEVRVGRLKACEAEFSQNPAIVEFSQTLESVEALPEIKQKMIEIRSQLAAIQSELQDKLHASEVEVKQSVQVDSALKLAQEYQENVPSSEELKPTSSDSREVLQHKLAQIEDSLSCLQFAGDQLEEVVRPLVVSFPEKQPICEQLAASLQERQQLLLVLREEVSTNLDELGEVEALTVRIAKELEHFAPQLESLKQPKANLSEKREVLALATQTRADYLNHFTPSTADLKNTQAEHANADAKAVLDRFENVAAEILVISADFSIL